MKFTTFCRSCKFTWNKHPLFLVPQARPSANNRPAVPMKPTSAGTYENIEGEWSSLNEISSSRSLA